MPDASSTRARPLAQDIFDARLTLRECLDKLLEKRGLKSSEGLGDFRAQANSVLPIDARLTLVRQALVLMRDFYANRPLKEALQAAQPVRRLELLHLELERLKRRQRQEDLPPALDFHREMNEIFTSVHDRHARYLLPEAVADHWALLGFDVEVFYDPPSPVVGEIRLDPVKPKDARVLEEVRLTDFSSRKARYMATHLIEGFEDALSNGGVVGFKPGVEIVSWNGLPIERAVELNGDRHAGANRAARHARGVTRLTTRPLRLSPLPDEEEWVMIGYRALDRPSEVHYVMLEWRVASLAWTPWRHDVVETIYLAAEELPESRIVEEIRFSAGDVRGGLDESTDEEAAEVGFLRQELWKEASYEEEHEPDEWWVPGVNESRIPRVLRAAPIKLPPSDEDLDNTIGYIRIYTFDVDPDALVEEFARLLRFFRYIHEAKDLIIDVRDNGGGRIPAGERLLQTLTPRRIEPERFEFLSNPTTFDFCRNTFLEPWSEALERSLELGAQYSGGFHISSERRCNDVGQVFFGRVVLIVNALSYSTTDVFAAGFQDHGIGPILATDDNVGAGGANTASHAELLGRWRETFEPLPHGAGMKVAIRRALRVGERIGTPLEEVGIKPDDRHFMTENDLLYHNKDLIHHAIKVLRSQPQLEVEAWKRTVNDAILVKPGKRVSRVEARWSRATSRPVNELILAEPPTQLHVEGFDGDRLVTNNLVNLHPRLELWVDWFVDYYTFLKTQAETGEPKPGFEEAVAAMTIFGKEKLGPLNELVIEASHVRSFRARAIELGKLTTSQAAGLCGPLHDREHLFLEQDWPLHRQRLAQEAGWLKENFLPSQSLGIADVMRALDLRDMDMSIRVYLVSELPPPAPGWFLASKPAGFVVSHKALQKDNLVGELLKWTAHFVRSLGADKDSCVYKALKSRKDWEKCEWDLLHAQSKRTLESVFGMRIELDSPSRKDIYEALGAGSPERVAKKLTEILPPA